VIHETPTQAMINGPGMTLTQWLSFSRDIAYREIRIFIALCSLPFEFVIPETPTQAVINGPDLILDSMAAIESRYRISRNWGSWCQVTLSFQSPNPRYSMKKINGPDLILDSMAAIESRYRIS
jgi:hypothetical protein